jgi:hypothetical protein
MVTGQCCGTGMFILDPDIFVIPDPGNNDSKKEKGKKEISCLTFLFVAIYFTKL